MNAQASILLVDDHPLFVEALRQVLAELRPRVRIQTAGTLAAARRILDLPPAPSLVLLDLNLPDSPGSQTLRRLPEFFAGIPVVVLSSLDDPQRVRQALAAGARGFISKSERPEKIMAALSALFDNGLCDTDPPAPRPPRSELSSRQVEVLELIAAGKSNKEIARDLGMALGTVKVHVRDIFERLGARNRTEAVALYSTLRETGALMR